MEIDIIVPRRIAEAIILLLCVFKRLQIRADLDEIVKPKDAAALDKFQSC